jgi:hypothetical protein
MRLLFSFGADLSLTVTEGEYFGLVDALGDGGCTTLLLQHGLDLQLVSAWGLAVMVAGNSRSLTNALFREHGLSREHVSDRLQNIWVTFDRVRWEDPDIVHNLLDYGVSLGLNNHEVVRTRDCKFVGRVLEAENTRNSRETHEIGDDQLSYRMLRLAAELGDTDVVRFLLDKGLDLDYEIGGKPVIEYAMEHYADDVTKLPLSLGAKLDPTRQFGRKMLARAVYQGDHTLEELLRSQGVTGSGSEIRRHSVGAVFQPVRSTLHAFEDEPAADTAEGKPGMDQDSSRFCDACQSIFSEPKGHMLRRSQVDIERSANADGCGLCRLFLSSGCPKTFSEVEMKRGPSGIMVKFGNEARHLFEFGTLTSA